MPDFAYLTFDLMLEAAAAGFRTRVLESPAGQASATFASPFSDSELATFLAQIGHRGPLSGLASQPDAVVKQFGGRLFDAVFNGEVLTSYRRSRDAADRASKGIRVRLRLNDVPALADLPWEYVYDATRQDFLALSKETPIVRFLDLPEPIAPLQAPPPLNILVIAPGPTDYDTLDGDGEYASLQVALQPMLDQKKVTLTRLQPPTLEGLTSQLRKQDYHILHFIGHGEYDKANQSGALVFEDAQKLGRSVSDEQIAVLLKDTRTLRLALLNACEGARTSTSNPFAGVAPRLIQQGIPAVLAMQFAISDPAAKTFSGEFYRTLADGYPVDAAVNEARRAMYFGGEMLEWGTPVLFMRADDGMLFVQEAVVDQNKDAGGKGSQHGGINISGTPNIHVGGDMVSGDKVVNGDSFNAGGDVNFVSIGAGAHVGQAAAGRNIQQQSGSKADDTQDLAAKLAEVERALENVQGQIDAGKFGTAQFQFQILQSELSKTDGTPSGTVIKMAAEGLTSNVPALGGPLGAVFHSPAAQKVVAQAGLTDWSKSKFG